MDTILTVNAPGWPARIAVCDEACAFEYQEETGLEITRYRRVAVARMPTCLYCAGCGRRLLTPQHCFQHDNDPCPPNDFLATGTAAHALQLLYRRYRRPLPEAAIHFARHSWASGAGITDGTELAASVWALRDGWATQSEEAPE